MDNEFIEKWKSQVKKGTLAFIVLNLLKHKEMYGYEIIEHVSKTISIDIAEGTLYPLLNKLKAEGVAKGSIVAVCIPNSIEMIISIYAVFISLFFIC